jgi:hypothetical protein
MSLKVAIARAKAAVAGGVALLMAVATGIAYILDLPPFRERGEILTSDVCATLGDATRAVTALERVLPDESSYSFDDSTTDQRIDAMDTTYDSACFVDGGGHQLVSVRTEMLQYETTDRWVKETVGQLVPVSSLTPFTAGDRAVASDKVAAIYVPCVKHGSLSVVGWLKKQGNAPAEELRQGLVSLVENAANYAHKKARCDLPAKVNPS